MKLGEAIEIGAASLLGALLSASFAVQVYGEVTGKYHYHFDPQLIELMKWVIAAFCGAGVTGVTAAGIATYRARTKTIEDRADDTASK